MRLLKVDLLTLRMPLVSPFTTSFGQQTERYPLLVRVVADHLGREVTGWGECVALPDPVYSSEYLDSARDVLQRYLVPAVAMLPGRAWGAEAAASAMRDVVGHPMAKAALEMAILDAQLRPGGPVLPTTSASSPTVCPPGFLSVSNPLLPNWLMLSAVTLRRATDGSN